MSETKKRLNYVDATKGLSILMIMMGHITSYSNPLDDWMSSFKVSIFYIISGFLLCYTQSINKRTFPQFASNLFKNLMIPYISFSIIATIFNIGRMFIEHDSSKKIMDNFLVHIFDFVFLRGIHALWFLPTIFFGEIIFYFLIKWPLFIRVIYSLAALYSITFFSKCREWLAANVDNTSVVYHALDRLAFVAGKSFMAAWFILAGYVIYILYAKIDKLQLKLFIGITFTLINISLSQINEHVDINMLKEGIHPYLFYICGIIGSIGAIALLDVITSKQEIKWLSFWGRNSLIVLCTHTALGFKSILLLGWRHYAFLPKHYTKEYLFNCFIILLLLMVFTAGVIQFVHAYCPFLIGKPFNFNFGKNNDSSPLLIGKEASKKNISRNENPKETISTENNNIKTKKSGLNQEKFVVNKKKDNLPPKNDD
ncbi:MAG: acyltransferase [Lachnospiraceae bacterium]|nr:acyltransferase [Lachnospiraceae bacterium]